MRGIKEMGQSTEDESVCIEKDDLLIVDESESVKFREGCSEISSTCLCCILECAKEGDRRGAKGGRRDDYQTRGWGKKT